MWGRSCSSQTASTPASKPSCTPSPAPTVKFRTHCSSVSGSGDEAVGGRDGKDAVEIGGDDGYELPAPAREDAGELALVGSFIGELRRPRQVAGGGEAEAAVRGR